MAPQGNIIIWLGGGSQIEVATFKAKEVDIKKEEYHKDVHYMFKEGYVERTIDRKVTNNDEVQARIARRGGLPPMDTYINTYRKQYHWKPVVEISQKNKIFQIGYNKYNGESNDILENQISSITYKKSSPLINDFGVRWKDELGQKYYIGVKFKEDKELINAFSQFAQDEVIDFTFRISDTNTLDKLSIKGQEKEIELTPSKVIAYKKE